MKFFRHNDYHNTPLPVYYPNNLGSSLKAGEYDYEFLVNGRNVPESQNRIIGLMLFHSANLRSINSSISGEDEFTLSVCADLEESDAGPKTISSQLQKLKFVDNVEYRRMTGKMFGSMFPLTVYGRQRLVALNSRTMINLSMRLSREIGSAGTSALFSEGRAFASDVIKDIKEILDESKSESEKSVKEQDPLRSENLEPDVAGYCVKCRDKRKIKDAKQVLMKNGKLAIQGLCPICETKMFKIGAKVLGIVKDTPLIENIQGYLRAAGWGTFQLRSEINGRNRSVTILDPPALGINGNDESYYCNQFLEGIAAGFLEGISLNARNELSLIGENYDSKNRIMTIQFAELVPKIDELPSDTRQQATSGRQKKKKEVEAPERAISEPSKAPVSGPEEVTTQPNIEAQEVDRIIRSLEEIEAQTRTVALPKTTSEGAAESGETSAEIVVQEKTA